MVRIIADTSTLYSTKQAEEAGFDVAPLSVSIAGKTYREFDEIQPDEFVALIQEGNMPTSSQPPIGAVVDLFNNYPGDEIINISVADGLSGTYQTAEAAKALSDNADHITVINSRTLCGPHRYLVENALEMVKKGITYPAIIRHTEELMKSARSFLIPQDFAYLRRGGRLSPLVSYVGQAIRFVPILTTTEDGRQLTVSAVKRNFAGAVDSVIKSLESKDFTEKHRIYITHAENLPLAEQAFKLLSKRFPKNKIEVARLSPAFITQGGPGCVAIQTIQSAQA